MTQYDIKARSEILVEKLAAAVQYPKSFSCGDAHLEWVAETVDDVAQRNSLSDPQREYLREIIAEEAANVPNMDRLEAELAKLNAECAVRSGMAEYQVYDRKRIAIRDMIVSILHGSDR